MKSVLIATHQKGFESDPIIDELKKRGIGFFRFNFDDGENVSLTSFSVNKGKINYSCDLKNISSEQIAVGWCQQLPPYTGKPTNQVEILQDKNLYSLQMATLSLLDVPWVNRPDSVEYASNKVNQLYCAKKYTNLLVPKTLISNNPEDIRLFAKDRKIIAKNLSTPWITEEGETMAAHTMIVSPDWLLDDSAVSFVPVIYQEYCKRVKDYRVIVVGNKIFAAECVPGENQLEDVRRGAKTGELYIPCEFKQEIIEELFSLMNILSIEYCAADFMEDENGNIFFLEVNTCGAWWWLERFYKGEICKAITDMIQKKGWS